jgi:predicted TIM-barrel fold metal-dependent hydrolase
VFIVDSQVHIWKEETQDRPWIKGARERMRLNGHREAAFTYTECRRSSARSRTVTPA